MARKTITIRHYVHTDAFKKEKLALEKKLSEQGYQRLAFGRDRAPAHSDVVSVYCWRWHGYWSGGCREFFARYFKPAS